MALAILLYHKIDLKFVHPDRVRTPRGNCWESEILDKFVLSMSTDKTKIDKKAKDAII